jgi:putative proteasome-type protease
MTYCLGLMLNAGLVLASDSLTNAGIDYVTSYSKMYAFNPAPDRVFMLICAGNLATTQELMNHLRRDLDYPNDGPNLANARYLFEAAEYVGQLSLAIQRKHAGALQANGISGETTLILGGQIQSQPHGLFLIYPQGNYIAAAAQTPYLQIGESKYGKPVLDRISDDAMSLEDGARLALVSLDATARSNVSVGAPFELAIYRKNRFSIEQRIILEQDHPLLQQTQAQWHLGLLRAFASLPRFPWETPSI